MPDPVRPPGTHNIIKDPKHAGVCLDCGAKGEWELIRSKPCAKNPPLNKPLADDLPSGEPAKEEKASDAVAMQILEDEAMALELLEEELLLEELELEELQLELHMLEKPEEQPPKCEEQPPKRPPATPCTAAGTVGPRPPALCHLVTRFTFCCLRCGHG